MTPGTLNTKDGPVRVVMLEESEFASMKKEQKKNWREHLYMGYLIVGTIAFALGIAISLRKLNGKQ